MGLKFISSTILPATWVETVEIILSLSRGCKPRRAHDLINDSKRETIRHYHYDFTEEMVSFLNNVGVQATLFITPNASQVT